MKNIPGLQIIPKQMKTEPVSSAEKPLSGISKLLLFYGAGATILLSYAAFALLFLALLALIGFEFLLVLVFARFGLARLMSAPLGAHIRLLMVFGRSFWLQKGVEYRIKLQRPQGPELFRLIESLCQKSGVKVPDEVSTEMSVNAWVRLTGYRRGSDRTVLGIGYDLLAGLSERECEAVVAHEITHAKLVQRGYKNWMNRGLGRMRQLAMGLYGYVEYYRRLHKSIEPGSAFFRIADRLTRLAARLVAACSRQDEFEADSGAAALCGSGPIRSSLLKLEALSERAARLPWNERIARLQMGEGFTDWLIQELSAANLNQHSDPKTLPFFKYSTHPSVADRIAALPPNAKEGREDGRRAIYLLQEPDRVAEVLISEIQKVAAKEEQKDSRRLKQWTKKGIWRTNLRPLQSFGVFAMLLGIAGGFIALLAGISLGLVCFVLAAVVIGFVSFHFGRYRDRLTLGVPDFSALKNASETPAKFTQDQVAAIEQELQQSVNGLKPKEKELKLATTCYEALSRCDYVRSHIAARLCLKVNAKSVEGAAGIAVAGAALGQTQQVVQTLHFLQKATGLATPSTTWAAGWALLLIHDWAAAEAFIDKRRLQKPGSMTLLLLLALCQSNRGKIQNALLLARQVCTPAPANIEHAKFIIGLLLRCGYLREAQDDLKRLNAEAQTDIELMLSMVRLNLMLRKTAEADKWTDLIRQNQPDAHLLVQLGSMHEVARQDTKAALFYNEALALDSSQRRLLD